MTKNHYIGDCMEQTGGDIIGTLKLNLKLPSGQNENSARERADAIADESVIPVLERVVDEYGGSGIGEIDSLALDLGQVTEDELPGVLERMLRNRLDRMAGRNSGDLVPDGDIFTVEYPERYEMPGNAPTPESYRKALVNYLSKPSAPWNSESGFNPTELIVKAMEGMDLESLEKWIVAELTGMDCVRLVRLEEMLVAGLASLVTAPSDGENGVGERKDSSEPEYGRVPEIRGGGFSEDGGDRKERSSLREMLEITRKIIWSDQVGRVLSFRVAAWKKYLWRSGIISRAEGEDGGYEMCGNDGNRRTWSGWGQKVERGAGEEEEEAAEHQLERIVETVGTCVSLGTENVDGQVGNFIGAEAAGKSMKDERTARGEVAIKVEESEEAERDEKVRMGENRRRSVEKGAVAVDERMETETGGSAPIARRADVSETIVGRIEETIGERTEGKAEERGEGILGNTEVTVGENDVWMPTEKEAENIPDRIFVSDAGLVLIHPFIRMLFRNMELLDEKGEFVSWLARIHAVHLLRYVSGHEGEHFDHSLTLEKILCGLPAGYVVPVSWKPGQRDREEADGLLRAVLSYWTTLGKASPEALQRSFLQRPGSVETDEGIYIVRVDGSAMDILMDDLPWEFSMIVLPWLKQPILVEWQR